MHDFPKPSSIVNKLDDKDFVEKFMEHMTILTRESGIDFVIDTSEDYIAKANKENGKIYFNPIYTLGYLNQLKEQIRKDTGVKSDFTFTERHLAQLMLHEINHYKNHAELKLSTKTVDIDGKTMTMIEYRHHIHRKYGQEFHRFENVCEDIDVDNHSIIQAPVYKSALDEGTEHLYIPSNDFSQLPLHQQFAWNCIGKYRLNEPCTVDPVVRGIVDYINLDGGPLQTIADPTITYDEQFPMIVYLYETYYLPLKAEQQKKEEEENENKEENQNKEQGDNKESKSEESKGTSQNQNSSNQTGQDSNDTSSGAKGSEDEGSQDQGQNQTGDASPSPEEQSDTSSQETTQTQPGKLDEGKETNESSLTPGDANKNQNGEGKKEQGDSAGKETTGQNSNNSSSGAKGNDSETKSKDLPQSGGNDIQVDNNDNSPQLGSGTQSSSSKNPPSPSLLPHIFDNLDKDGKPQATPNTDNTIDKTQQQLNNALKDGSSGAERSGVEGSPNNQKNTNPFLNALQQAVENTILESRKTPEDRTLENQIANERGLDPDKNKDEIMKQKKKIKKRKEEIDPKLKALRDRHGDKIYDKIVDEIFAKIVSLRSKSTILEKTPRRFSNGGQFDGRSLVGGIMSWKAGDSDPLIMKQQLREQKELPKAGAFNITLILDGSGSMNQPAKKNEDQKLSALLILTALNQLNEQLKESGLGLTEDFLIQTQALMFQGGGKVKTVKERSKSLNLKDIINANDHLDYKNGPDTNAYDAMKKYYTHISKPLPGQTLEDYTQRLEDIKSGKIKEVLFVMSDGGFNSGDDSKAKTLNKKLRDMSVIVCGIGITADGHPMEEIFGKKSENPEENTGGFGLVCEQTADLGITLNSLLLEHLEDPSIIGVG